MTEDEHVCKNENKDKPMVRADTDKPHRCPSCWSVLASVWDGGSVRWWRSYRCQCCGQKFARWPWLNRTS